MKQFIPAMAAQIVRAIRKGALPHVAASAWGLNVADFEQWMEAGIRNHKHSVYRKFRNDVESAQSTARMAAEQRVWRENPLHWLRNGPGKELPNLPGWSMPARPQEQKAQLTVNILSNPLFAFIMKQLEPFPEAKAAAAKALYDASHITSRDTERRN